MIQENNSTTSQSLNSQDLEVKALEEAALEIRKNLLTLCSQQVIHIGGDLSVADVMTVLWQYQMNYDPKNPKDELRDRFVLSKGHAAAVTSFNQAAIGCYQTSDIFKEYAHDNGRFAMHSCNLINPHVEVSTGSLGHGLPVAAGLAEGLKLKHNTTSRVYVVMGDGEQSEGSIWEAVLNAAHYHLGNLIGIIDCNKLGFDGTLDEITALGDIADKYRAFGWNVTEVDGHDIRALMNAFDHLPPTDFDKPTVLICHTVKGHGVSFMENSVKWHAGRLSDEKRDEAIKQLEDAFAERWGNN